MERSWGEQYDRIAELAALMEEFYNQSHQDSGSNGGQFTEGKDGPGRVRDKGTEDLGKPGIRSGGINKPAPGGPGPSHKKGAGAGASSESAAAPKSSSASGSSGVSVSSKYTAGNPKGLVKQGNLDLGARPRVIHSEDGECVVSTVRSISIGTDEGETLIPTVVGNAVLSNSDAIAHYQKTGQNLGTFKDAAAADAYGEALHEQQAKDYPDATAAECKAAGLSGGTESAPAPAPAATPTPAVVGKDVNAWLKNPDKGIQAVVQETLQKVLEGAKMKGNPAEIAAAQKKLDLFMEKNGLAKPAAPAKPAGKASGPAPATKKTGSSGAAKKSTSAASKSASSSTASKKPAASGGGGGLPTPTKAELLARAEKNCAGMKGAIRDNCRHLNGL